jgi:hypothetical protein
LGLLWTCLSTEVQEDDVVIQPKRKIQELTKKLLLAKERGRRKSGRGDLDKFLFGSESLPWSPALVTAMMRRNSEFLSLAPGDIADPSNYRQVLDRCSAMYFTFQRFHIAPKFPGELKCYGSIMKLSPEDLEDMPPEDACVTPETEQWRTVVQPARKGSRNPALEYTYGMVGLGAMMSTIGLDKPEIKHEFNFARRNEATACVACFLSAMAAQTAFENSPDGRTTEYARKFRMVFQAKDQRQDQRILRYGGFPCFDKKMSGRMGSLDSQYFLRVLTTVNPIQAQVAFNNEFENAVRIVGVGAVRHLMDFFWTPLSLLGRNDVSILHDFY